MKRYIIPLALLLILTGCDRYLDSPDLPGKLPAPPPVPVGLLLTHESQGLTLSWEISDTAAVRQFRIYVGDSLNDRFRLRDSTATFSHLLSGLNNGRLYFFRVSAVDQNYLEGALSDAVFSRPGVLSISINNDALYTRNKTVNVSFVVPVTASLVQLSERSDFADATWLSFAPSISRILSDGDGVKRLYARFQFGDGSGSALPVSDSIILDTRAVIDTIYFTAGTNPQPGQIITFYLVSDEPGGTATVSFPGVTSISLYDDGTEGDIQAGDGRYTRRYVIPVNFEVVDGIVRGRFIDAAGNEAEGRTAPTLLNIQVPPTAVTLAVHTEGQSSILTWTTNNDDDFASYRIYRDTSPDIDPATASLLVIINSQSTTTFTDTRPDGAPYYYRIFVFDNQALSAGSNEVSAP